MAGDDPDVERMPEDEELWGALLYAEEHAAAVKDPALRRAAALVRTELWERLRAEVDLHQSRAVAHARDAGAEWAELVAPLNVGAPSGAYNKARRLRAAELSAEPEVGPLRRTPEAAAGAEAALAAAGQRNRQREQREMRRQTRTLAVARQLLAVREELHLDEEADYWLDELAAVTTDCRTPRQYASAAVYLTAADRHIRRHERQTGHPATSTPAAGKALAAIAVWASEAEEYEEYEEN